MTNRRSCGCPRSVARAMREAVSQLATCSCCGEPERCAFLPVHGDRKAMPFCTACLHFPERRAHVAKVAGFVDRELPSSLRRYVERTQLQLRNAAPSAQAQRAFQNWQDSGEVA